MSLWCPYIKANYCFLWSCNKYILRHLVAKGADCFQERTWKHVLLATGKGPRQPRVSPPGIQQQTLWRLLLHQLAEKGKGLAPSPGPAPPIWWWVGTCQGKRQAWGWKTRKAVRAPGQPPWCGFTAPSRLSTPMASVLPIQQLAEQWDPRLLRAIIAKLPACHAYPWMWSSRASSWDQEKNLRVLLKKIGAARSPALP